MGEHMLALAGALKDQCQLSFICPPTAAGQSFIDRAVAAGLEVFAWELADGARRRLLAWLGARSVDVFHIHAGIAWEATAAAGIAREAGIPVVLRTEHLPYQVWSARQADRHRRMLHHLDRIICVSQASRASFLHHGLPSGVDISVVRNGIPALPPAREREAFRAELGLGPGTLAVLTVARFTEQKDHATLVSAMPAIVGRFPDIRFLWVGTGPLKPKLQVMLDQAGMTPYVVWLGRRTDVPDLLRACDLFVLPSRYEGLPLVAIEAMASGLPVVGTRVSGTAEVVNHGETGLLVPSGDAQGLAGAVCELLSNPALAARLVELGRAAAAGPFSATRMAAETLTVYRDLLRRSETGDQTVARRKAS